MIKYQQNADAAQASDLQDDLYLIEAEQVYLVASRCNECSRVHFPKRDYCAACATPNLSEIRLSQVGHIGAFSLIDRQPADAFIKAPYLQAEIEMPEGVSVFTVIEPPAASDLKIGMEARTILRVFETPNGQKRTFMFQPVLPQGGAK